MPVPAYSTDTDHPHTPAWRPSTWYRPFFHTLLFGPLCLGYISQLVDTVIGYFCISFLSNVIYSVLCLYLIQPIGCHTNKIIIITTHPHQHTVLIQGTTNKHTFLFTTSTQQVLMPLRRKDWERFCGFRGQQRKQMSGFLTKPEWRQNY